MNTFFRTGIDLGGTKIESIVLDSKGSQVFRKRIPSPQGSYIETVNAITELVLEADNHVHEITRVGIGIPGALSEQTGLVKNANSTWLIGKPLKSDLEYSLKRRIKIENDANCFTISEAVDGAGAQAQIVFGVILGTGVGGGITINANSLRGINLITGEWGHNPLPWTNERELNQNKCYCGKKGCIETFLSGPAVAKNYYKKTGKVLNVENILALSEAGDLNAQGIFNEFEIHLAKGLAQIINILDPDIIVIGGGLSNISRLYGNTTNIWDKYIFSDCINTKLVPARHGDTSGVRGAAWLWND
jgi:fructokinase|tara:strand:+ start:1188 stop:2096 length:909 start_codon:yes stop_codon:yes gene_type:complete